MSSPGRTVGAMSLPKKGWPRLLAIRRVVAAVLVLLAVALAFRGTPEPTGVPMLVAAHDLPAGVTLAEGDVRVVQAPPELRPAGALTAVAQAADRVLAHAATALEPLTRTRLAGPENARLTTGDPAAAAVPFRVADPAVAALLAPGVRVDVVTLPQSSTDPVVLATNATVLTVRPADESDGRLVVLALPRPEATRLAGASLGQPVAVTLR